MAKEFYTERDIEDMVQRGVRSLLLTDEVVLTELAFERAKRLGLVLDREHVTPPAAPLRPYLSEAKNPLPRSVDAASLCSKPFSSSSGEVQSVKERVRNAVKAQFGEKIDENLLEVIIQRVLNSVGV
jgi:hypothetical protein